ncbi:hypothetical protein CEXT_616051 [Caerostris extrusa]|uniref:Uncharacterized protein n=1 Tax=Caerostris extrusa TaxID=172846 RepID=A0AAV4SMD1_CAEEX|nr:hypothetical protein CEXT_616051 [Caerostris extrusa]
MQQLKGVAPQTESKAFFSTHKPFLLMHQCVYPTFAIPFLILFKNTDVIPVTKSTATRAAAASYATKVKYLHLPRTRKLPKGLISTRGIMPFTMIPPALGGGGHFRNFVAFLFVDSACRTPVPRS